MVALVTILLNNKVSGEGPEGIEGLLSRGVRWGQKRKSLFSLETRKDPSLQSEHKKHKKKSAKSIRRMRIGMPPSFWEASAQD